MEAVQLGMHTVIVNANANVEINNSEIKLIMSRSNAPGTLTGIFLSNDSTLTLNNTPIYIEAKYNSA